MYKDDKLIAEFLGWTLGHPNPEETRWKNFWFDSDRFRLTESEFSLGFDLDWNMLIKVLNEIYLIVNSLDYESELYSIFEDEFSDYTLAEIMQNDIESVYERCVNFIKKYNEYKKENQ